MAKRSILPLVILTTLLTPSIAPGQGAAPGAPAPQTGTRDVLTILTEPAVTRLRLDSKSGELHGLAPLDVPATFEGPFRVMVEGPGVARSHGSILVPGYGGRITLLSEPRGPSLELFLRSANFPGFSNIGTGRVARGLVLSTAFVGSAVQATRAHLRYRDRLGEFGDYADDRARDERLARGAWARYAAATWAASAVDYWLRPRIDIEESATQRAVLSAPTLSRTSILWRSIVIPGAGQEFANQQGRGALWLGAVFAAGAGIVIADGMVERDQTQVDWAEVMIDSAGPSERPERVREWERQKRDLQSSEDLRRGFRYALIGTYLANVIDAFFVPTGKPAPAGRTNLSTSAIIRPDGPEFQATLRF